MFGTGKSTARREEIRKNRPDTAVPLMTRLREGDAMKSLAVAVIFCVLAICILVMREDVVSWRPGQWTHHDIVARVEFPFRDERKLEMARQTARDATPRVFRQVQPDPIKQIEDELLSLPDRVKGLTMAELPQDLAALLDASSLARLQEYHVPPQRQEYEQSVHNYIEAIRQMELVVISEEERKQDLTRMITVQGLNAPVGGVTTYTTKMRDDLSARFQTPAAKYFRLTLQPQIVNLTRNKFTENYVFDEGLTIAAANRNEQLVSPTVGNVLKAANSPIVKVEPGGRPISHEDWLMLKRENQEYLSTLGVAVWGQRVGLGFVVALMTTIASAYVARYQPRIVRNVARAAAIALLLLAMLLVAQLAALGSSSIYIFGIAPTILTAMILCIAYEQRFALGIATFHAVLVTLAMDANLTFLMILETGVVTCCFLLDELRTRSKLIEVGGMTALAMIVATAAAGALSFDPLPYIAKQCLYTGAAGLGVGFVVLGILPFIEKTFRITTSMTLLELADVSHPLLRRLSVEAPGTYNHSLQVATIAEEAAESIGANSLLCRVGSYYHDVGKINKADYFVENQVDGQNRHLNLSPNVSRLIIHGHVKDGVEMGKEYNLPTNIIPFIQQHHGTTVVEYFYQRACDTCEPEHPDPSKEQFRYPGPKPRTREIAILMIADAVESAARTMTEPSAARIEALVEDIAMKRLLDGQFDDCDLTMRDLDKVKHSLIKTLLGIYHGRIVYPSTSAIVSGTTPETPANPITKSA